MPIKVYGTKLCGACKNMKSFLTSIGIAFLEIDITENQDARDEIVNRGFRQIPVVKIGEELIGGYDLDKIKRLLKI